jgi:DNA sulfur modification protein DndD
MILNSIILENFGIYGGCQKAILTPEKGRPIILLGGMNGGGKTTLLDAIQLVFYGPKARISNRGRMTYNDYLRESIHRDSDPHEGASITLHFQRIIDGKACNFELQRHWHVNKKGVEENIRVLRDGQPDEIYTEYWNETIESYLPSSIAHLFFFDGEQIKDLAEGKNTAKILGTAIHSLLGLDLVDRLENDLKIFERRKKNEKLDQETVQKLTQVQGELEEIHHQQEQAAMAEGSLTNEAGRLAKEMRAKEDEFRKEGGDIFLKRKEIEAELALTIKKKEAADAQLRELASGPLPLILVDNLLLEVEQIVLHEAKIKRARTVQNILSDRDTTIVEELKNNKLPDQTIKSIAKTLEADRKKWLNRSQEELILNTDDSLAPQIAHLRQTVLPAARQQATELKANITSLKEKITRLENDLERVPPTERIAELQEELTTLQSAHQAKLTEIEAVKMRQIVLTRQRQTAEARLNSIGERDIDAQFAEDSRLRILKHSEKVRKTLEHFRFHIIQKHTEKIQELMLESFQKLLQKKGLVEKLTINPQNFEVILSTKGGQPLSFDRLSAGEKQLLATSLLWGLARASGRAVPTIIDTPLGRLDSSHRKHLVERYFPNASHQVLLLSTDEEIMGSYLKKLRPFISRTYLLDHNEIEGKTKIVEGYFET